MIIDGPIIREQGVTFGIIVVKPQAIAANSVAEEIRVSFHRLNRTGVAVEPILTKVENIEP